MTLHDVAPADGDDDPRPLDSAVIAMMRETILASHTPTDTVITLLGGAVGHLRGTVGDRNAVAVLLRFAAEANANGR